MTKVIDGFIIAELIKFTDSDYLFMQDQFNRNANSVNRHAHNSNQKKQNPRKIAFLLLEKFTMLSLASAVEPLRMANQLTSETFYQWCLVSETGESVKASDGIEVSVDQSIDDFIDFHVLIVVGGVDGHNSFTKNQLRWLRRLDKKNIGLGGVCTGPFALAAAGLLNNYACSAHWDCLAALQESYPGVICTNRLFVIDKNRMTSTGGTAPMDMMLKMINNDHGYAVVTAISEMFICDRVRDEKDQQKVPLKHLLGTTQPKLLEAAELMEANIEEPISLEELAGYVNISRRQLERLFKNYLDCSPSRYYLRIRLGRARQLLKQTSMSIVEIASVCGFISTPHFSKCYKAHMGLPPREERMAAQSSQKSG